MSMRLRKRKKAREYLVMDFVYVYFQVDISQRDWLRNSGWNPDKNNVILVHGYGGSENALPMSVLKDGNWFLFHHTFWRNAYAGRSNLKLRIFLI